jgi:TonB family protein
MEKHVKKHLKYPKEAKKNNIESRVSSHFEIDINGKVTNIQVRGKQSEYKSLFEEEAKQIISLLPNFIPATQRKKPVAVKYAIPINFKL